MSYQSVQTALVQIRNPSFVPPVNGEELGKEAFFYAIDREESWPDAVQRGWNAAFDKVAGGIAIDDYLAAAKFVEEVLA